MKVKTILFAISIMAFASILGCAGQKAPPQHPTLPVMCHAGEETSHCERLAVDCYQFAKQSSDEMPAECHDYLMRLVVAQIARAMIAGEIDPDPQTSEKSGNTQ